jgi:1,2-dihydroxy-3-keto-5-methylthiopentene dioxygenase
MSCLTVFDDKNPASPVWESREFAAIAKKLGSVGVRFEQWKASVDLPSDADDALIMKAYTSEIERLKREEGYQAVDVIRVLPDNPKRVELRQKFLSEHIHVEDEVRFFVDGAGMFYLHIDGHVYMTLCERGDLIGVPDGVPHWFDFGAVPHVAAIRLFTNAEGWVAQYTGDKIADLFPKFENQKAAA